MKKQALIAAAVLLSSVQGYGAGYQVNVQGIRQIAMASTGTSWPRDAATIFYNPAGLSRLKGIQAYGSMQFLFINTQYVQSPTAGYSARTEPAVYTPFNFYVGGPIREESKLGIGLGIYTPFGSGSSWKNDWEGRYVIQSIALQSIFFQPTVSYAVSDMLSVGGGFIYAIGNVKLQKAIPLQDENGEDGQAEIKGKSDGVGFNLGVHLNPIENLQIGLNYRSKVNMKIKDGDAKFQVPSALSSSFPSTSVSSELPLPSVFTIGVGYKVMKNLTLQAEANFVGWKAYDSLRFDFETNTPQLQDASEARLYKNTVAFRLGVHYQASDRIELMLGGAIDPTPVRDGYVSPDLPDADRYIVTGGLTFKVSKKLTVLTAIELGTSKKRDAQYLPDNFNGEYQTKAVIPCIGITYDF